MGISSVRVHLGFNRNLREAKSSVAATPVLTSTASSSKKFSTDKYETPILSSQGEAIKKTSLRTPLMTMASSSKKSSASKHATPILSTKGGAIKKTSLWTPLSSALFTSNVTPSSCLYMSRNRSPYKTGSEQHKDWMNEQLAKVLNFLQNRHNCPDSIKQILKPPITIETFVFVINILFKEINPAINVQNVNYKTVVVNTLKMLHYPGNIKNSLLQTVNTKHAWHDVISMFSWLVDLVSTINSVPVQPSEDDDLKRKKIECITDFLTMRYLSYNGTGNREEIDREFGEKFARILKLDQYEINDLKLRVSELRKNEQKKLTKLENKQAKNENLQRKINKMQDEIDTYYENKKEKEDDTKYAIEALKDRRERLQAIFLTKREKVAQLTAVVNKQLYTTADKKRIVQHIDELQHTISLKKESIRVKKTLKDESNIKLAEAKKELLTQIYHFNNRVMKLASIEPVLKQLYLKEKDFWSNEFQSLLGCGRTLKEL
ncbi:kinetochore protein NDC80 homolog [Zophobas morio]|uniref:kinetochore protein NDC80 homolog n=1 Tax=Zophobas morio TaxID=2755281 RepID=UPI003082EC0E